MRKVREKSPKFGGIDTQGWVNFLRVRHPFKTAQAVASEIGAPERTVEKWLDHSNAPSLWWFARMVCVYGPEFLSAAMVNPPEWLSAAALGAQREQVARRMDELTRESERLSAALRARPPVSFDPSRHSFNGGSGPSSTASG